MTAARPQRIVLIGLLGTGKSTVARLVARRLRWEWRDSDEIIVSHAGRDIPTIFRESGEPEFRRLERDAIARVTEGTQVTIATGGGAVLDPVNRARLWQDAFVVHLHARPASLAQRMANSKRGIASRPLLDSDDPRGRIERLYAARAPVYALADWVIATDALSPGDVADEVVAAWERRAATLVTRPGRMEEVTTSVRSPEEPGGDAAAEPVPAAADPDLAVTVTTPGGSYPAYAGWNAMARLPRWLRAAGLGPVVHVIADKNVAELYGAQVLDTLAEGGFEPLVHEIELSESRKSGESATEIYDALVAARAERKHTVLALGGGVATDLGGFVAATYLRGMPLVHVPTSLLGMVDAAIGGKVAINHREGKNLIGAFYQPRLVVADAAVLATLPRREFISGWAEVIKHALIMDVELLEWLEREADALLRLEPEPLTRVLRRSIALKAQVVSADEREDGLRMTLNYGHTTGHGLEAATGYDALLHGEAVAVGMVAAAEIALRMGLIDHSLVQRQNALIARFGLPLRAPGVDVDAVLAAMRLDKKVVGKALRFVLLDRAGHTIFRTDVPEELVRDVVSMVTSA